MKRSNKHIGLDDFKRYRANQMSEAERNAFERELLKAPFEKEAFEGLQSLTDAQIDADLKELEAQVNLRKRKPVWPYWTAAASLLLLLLTGILLNELKDKTIIQEVAQQSPKIEVKEVPSLHQEPVVIDSSIQSKEPERLISPPKSSTQDDLSTLVAKSKDTSTPEDIQNEKSLISMSEKPEEVTPLEASSFPHEEKSQSIEVPLQGKVAGIRIRGNSAIRKSMRQTGDSLPGAGIVRRKVIDQETEEAMPGVTITEKGTLNGAITDVDGNFTLQLSGAADSTLVANFVGMKPLEFEASKDSLIIARMKTDQLALDEVVVVGYGITKKESVTGSVSRVETKEPSSYQRVMPIGGFKMLREYLQQHAVLPNNYPEEQVVVRVRLILNNRGQIVDINNQNKADEEIFKQAEQLLLDGPHWCPAQTDDASVASKVALRIVFRKSAAEK